MPKLRGHSHILLIILEVSIFLVYTPQTAAYIFTYQNGPKLYLAFQPHFFSPSTAVVNRSKFIRMWESICFQTMWNDTLT